MIPLFQRWARLQVGPFSIPGGTTFDAAGNPSPAFRMDFKVRKNIMLEFNTFNVNVYGLAAGTRKKLEKGMPVLLEAGYKDLKGLMFKGYTRVVDCGEYEGPEVVTKLQCGDGYLAQYARVNLTFPPGTTVAAVATAIAASMGVRGVLPGNVAAKFIEPLRNGLLQFSRGLIVRGQALDQFNKLCKSAGVSWSIQDGQIQVQSPVPIQQGLIPYISTETGLIGSPSFKKWKLGWPTFGHFKSLLNPTITCGGQAVLNSREWKGQVRIRIHEMHGNTHSNEWYSQCEFDKGEGPG